MNIFGRKKFPEFTELENQFDNIKFWDKDKINKNYSGRLSSLLTKIENLIQQYPKIEFLVVFMKKDKRKSWYSEIQDRVVLNVNFDPSSQESNEELKKAIEDYRLVESEIAKTN